MLQTLEVCEATYHRWRNQFGGMKSEEAKRLKELDIENARLKRLLAEAELDKAILKKPFGETVKPDAEARKNCSSSAIIFCFRTSGLSGVGVQTKHASIQAKESSR